METTLLNKTIARSHCDSTTILPIFHTLCTNIHILLSSIGMGRCRKGWLDFPISAIGETYTFYVAMSCPHGVLTRCRCRTTAFSFLAHFDVTLL